MGWGRGGEGVFYIFDVPSGEGFNDFRWNPIWRRGVKLLVKLLKNPEIFHYFFRVVDYGNILITQ